MATFVGVVKRVDGSGIPLLVARLFVGLLFAYLAYNKIADPFEFLKQVREYHAFAEHPPQLINAVAAAVPWFEMVCAAALLLGVFVRGAALLIFGMLLFFGPLLLWRAWMLYSAPEFAGGFCDVKFDCGCGTGEVFICFKMLENTAAQLACLIPLFSRSRFLCLSSLLTRKRTTQS